MADGPDGVRPEVRIAEPYFGEAERAAVLEVLASGTLIQGPRVARFERAFAAYHGVEHGVATSSGTTALMAALMAHEIGRGDEVIVPSFSFFATASAVLSVGATPVFADIDAATYCLCPIAAERAITPRTRAILPVHLYGLAAAMPAFEALCRERGLVLLEDAAQAHGARIGARSVGSWGTAAFSFFPSKNMTTGEGGMLLTNDERIAERLRRIRQQGRDEAGLHVELGYNFRMTELAGALGLAQLDRLPAWQARRADNARYFDRHIAAGRVPEVPPAHVHAYHQYTLRLPSEKIRDALEARLLARGIGVRVYYRLPIHRQPLFERSGLHRELELPETERAAREVLSLPVHPGVTDEQRRYVAEQVNAAT